ncbi:GGDEF domain-containing protein [Reinekea sp.]|jgi:diguanylate cyclase (GGDEF)-like protein|uniref:GGDEF domain-containing protein n=1 Tax=Reinekea sp. TaxID=1970455 RepID=UPI002A7FD9E9|nr:GGDEF domain-containing protein [Reinekea sp.]
MNLLSGIVHKFRHSIIFESQPYTTAADLAKAHQIARRVALVVGLCILSVSLIRPLMSSLPIFFVLVGLITSAIFFAIWYQFHCGKWLNHSAVILLGAGNLILLPMVVLSGGVMTQYAPIIMILPFVSMLLGGARLAIISTLFWSLFLIFLYSLGHNDYDLTRDDWELGKFASRTVWMVLGTVVALMLAIQQEIRSRLLLNDLLKLSEIDPLTGVNNRRGLENILEHEITLSSRTRHWLTVMIIDVDFFKRYNDLNGHGQGDLALVQVAQTLFNHARQEQDSVARFGGEEFVVVLRNTDPVAARRVGEKFREQIRALNLIYQAGEREVLTITCGFYSVNSGAETQEELIGQADKALYFGKANGRDQVVDAQGLG